jgi:hypothetical protein
MLRLAGAVNEGPLAGLIPAEYVFGNFGHVVFCFFGFIISIDF